MNLTEIFLSFMRPEREIKKESPAGLCPNCGNYRYSSAEVKEVPEIKQTELRNSWERYMFIQDIVKEQVGGIKLKGVDISFYSSCSCRDHQKVQNEKTYKTP